MMIIPKKLFAIVGQNPKTDQNVSSPFLGTRSHSVLKNWLSRAGIDESEVMLINSVDTIGKITPSQAINEAIKDKSLVLKLSKYKFVVSLGEVARSAVRASKVLYPLEMAMTHDTHFSLPHPSGLNRKLNDPEEHEMAVLTLMTVKSLAKMEAER